MAYVTGNDLYMTYNDYIEENVSMIIWAVNRYGARKGENLVWWKYRRSIHYNKKFNIKNGGNETTYLNDNGKRCKRIRIVEVM